MSTLVEAHPDVGPAAELLTSFLQPARLSSEALVAFLSFTFLAVAASVFMYRCPSRVKEFSRDQWCDQLGEATFTYLSLAWQHRAARLICAFCYLVGGLLAGYFIVRNWMRVVTFVLFPP